MFGYSAGRSAYPQVYSVNTVKRGLKKETHQSKPKEEAASTVSLEPAIDGPPSPERIRAYTEQMKRSSIFGNSSRSNTFSSVTPSFRSRDSVSPGTDSSLSRKSSYRSNASNMPSSRSPRPESVQIFGSIFSRSGRKMRKEANASSTTLSTTASTVTETPIEEDSIKNSFYEGDGKVSKAQESSRRHLISTPYDFQHVTHTRQDHLPNLENSSETELVSGFSAIRASQAPTKGELKGIRAQDLHFENFSSESLHSPTKQEDTPPTINPKSPRRQRSVLRKSGIPARLSTKSQGNLRSPPPRPPRSPQSPLCPVDLPARTSSRTASLLYDTFDPLATTTLERPHTNGGFRRSSPFGLPSPPPIPPPPPSWSEQDVYFADGVMSHAVTTPGDEAWPLSASGAFGAELADVQEEEEEPGSRQSRTSQSSNELRVSQSVPALRLKSHEQDESSKRSEARVSATLGRDPATITSTAHRQPLPSAFQRIRDSWEDDVDFCYENEIEADFDYQWDRCDEHDETSVERPVPSIAQPRLDLHLEDDDRSVYHGRFRPSLLVPSALDLPELSPMSNSSTPSNDPRTPSNFLRPSHARSPSHASSFKESHGFTLSPTLLIPTDFQNQMDQEALYDEPFNSHSASGTIFSQEPFNHSISPVDESICSTASYRSSAFSHGSARSSSSTRISTANSRGSQDSVNLLSRAASVSKAHRSVSSASSLPELIPPALRSDSSSDSELPANLSSRNGSEETLDSAPATDVSGPPPVVAPVGHRRNKSLVGEPGLRRGVNHFAPAPTSDMVDTKNLSPVAESFVDMGNEWKANTQSQVHGRKGSVPLAGTSTSREFKGRARAATASAGVGGKTRGSYMLFPQI